MIRFFSILGFAALVLSSCETQTERIAGYTLHGIDISRYQGKIDWKAVAEQNVSFSFVKATEGKELQDKFFCENWEGMKREGIKRGAYHFFRPRLSARTQAENFMKVVDMQYGDLPPVLDVELEENLSREEIVAQIHEWLYLVELKYSVKPIIYTHYKFYNKYIAGEFNSYPIWIAKYGDIPPRLGGAQWHFWQYGNKGRLRGIEGDIDFNVFYGNSTQLENMCLSGKMLSGGTDRMQEIRSNKALLTQNFH
jgi:lysozyme